MGFGDSPWLAGSFDPWGVQRKSCDVWDPKRYRDWGEAVPGWVAKIDPLIKKESLPNTQLPKKGDPVTENKELSTLQVQSGVCTSIIVILRTQQCQGENSYPYQERTEYLSRPGCLRTFLFNKEKKANLTLNVRML